MNKLTLPPLFQRMHQRAMESYYHARGSVFYVMPIEPLGAVNRDIAPDSTVTLVTVRGVNEGGSLRFEAYSEADLAVAAAWAEKHKDTTQEEFNWLPSLGEKAR
jgi:hypothetical protein